MKNNTPNEEPSLNGPQNIRGANGIQNAKDYAAKPAPLKQFFRNKKPAAWKTAIILALLLICTSANANILASASVDKTTLGENEVAFLSVKMMNDSNSTAKNVFLRVQADEGITFYDGTGETTIFIKTIDSINPGEIKEILLKTKAAEIKSETANIYAYYGTETELRSGALTAIKLTSAGAQANISSKNESIKGQETISINFSLKNDSGHSIDKVSAETLAPEGFEILTPPAVEEKIYSGETMSKTFRINIPIEANGEKTILIAYGYFDNNIPHYFEQTVKFNVQRTNYPLIAIIAAIVLVAAGLLYLNKKGPKGIEGTAEKADEKPMRAKK